MALIFYLIILKTYIYIGRQRRGRGRDIPMFPIEAWNMYERTLDELPRTNNHMEGWHKRFQNTCSCAHPDIWKFIKLLQGEESLVHVEIRQMVSGHPPPKQKRAYADSATRVRNIVVDYPNRRHDILHYLMAISYNIGF